MGDVCEWCQHPADDHRLMMVEDDEGPTYAGWMECPVEGCDCWSTWAAAHPDLPHPLGYVGGDRAARVVDDLRAKRGLE
jgi:hypothetical protein